MSASQSETDREHEALKRAQRSHEASMDEILASIRAIIADDTTANVARPVQAPVPQVIYSNFGQAKTAAEALFQIPPKEPAPPTVVWSRPEQDEVAASPVPAPPAAASPAADEPLLSEEADRAIAQSFQALAATVAMPSPERIEELARETLRPMVKVWLDENLPSLVERLVRAEIQRVARGGR